jgi:hypothetical protein
MHHKKQQSEDEGHGLQRKKEGELPRLDRKKAYNADYGRGAQKQCAPGCADRRREPGTTKRNENSPNAERHK